VERLAGLWATNSIVIKTFEVGYHYMMHCNLDTLSDFRVRKAINIAIDRMALSQTLAGGTGTRSLFPDYSHYYLDDSDPHGDVETAAALLDEAGLMLNETSGKRENSNGTVLSIRLVACPHRPGLPKMQPVIEATLTRNLGMTVKSILTGDDWDETQTIVDERSFDLLFWAQHTLPAGDPLWFLSSFFRSESDNNHANFQSDTVDFLLDQLSVTEEHEARVNATSVVHRAILAEVPVSNLVTPFWHVGLSKRMADYEAWGSDYHVIRSDLLFLPGAEEESTEGGKQSSKGGGEGSDSSSSGTKSQSSIVFGRQGMILMMLVSSLLVMISGVLQS
jgi:peptide/nickel transport system substrate-binding protein